LTQQLVIAPNTSAICKVWMASECSPSWAREAIRTRKVAMFPGFGSKDRFSLGKAQENHRHPINLANALFLGAYVIATLPLEFLPPCWFAIVSYYAHTRLTVNTMRPWNNLNYICTDADEMESAETAVDSLCWHRLGSWMELLFMPVTMAATAIKKSLCVTPNSITTSVGTVCKAFEKSNTSFAVPFVMWFHNLIRQDRLALTTCQSLMPSNIFWWLHLTTSLQVWTW